MTSVICVFGFRIFYDMGRQKPTPSLTEDCETELSSTG